MHKRISYSPTEAGMELDVSRVTIHKLIREGELKSFKIGRLRRISRDAIDEYINKQELLAERGQ